MVLSLVFLRLARRLGAEPWRGLIALGALSTTGGSSGSGFP